MLLRQMQYFLAAVACKNFGQAAKLCYVSQPAFSLQIKNLERELGVKLINRNNCSFELTPAGERFYGPCKKIVGELDALTKDMQILSQEHFPPQFTIGCRRNYNLSVLINSVNTINSSNNNYHLKITYRDYGELLDMLKKGDIDFLITEERYDDYSAFNSELIGSGSIMVCLTPGSLPADKKFIDVNELKNYGCVIIVDQKYESQEKEFLSQLLNYHGSFTASMDMADSVTYLVDKLTPSFIPIAARGRAPKFYKNYTDILPIVKNNEPIMMNYKIYWSKDREKLTAIAQQLAQLIKNHK